MRVRRRARRARRGPAIAMEGDTVVEARVQARLLGLPLLEIDAHVVVAPQRRPAVVEAGRSTRAPAPALDGPAPPGLGRAVRLLAEGSQVLEDARRLA